MWIYWTLFSSGAFPAVFEFRRITQIQKYSLFFLWLFIVLLIGLRFEVGPDWEIYIQHLREPPALSLRIAVFHSEPGYWTLNWLANILGCGVWFVNLVCAIIFATGVVIFSKSTLNTWLALTVSIPFLVIVVGMNYTRQSVALGLLMMGITALQRGKILIYVIFVCVGAIFHASSVIALPLGLLAVSKKRIWCWTWIGAACGLGYYAFIRESMEALTENYVVNEMTSGGTVVRVLMNASAAICIIGIGKKTENNLVIRNFWLYYSLSSIPFVIAVIVFPPYTVIDRLALYWMPLQIYAFANLPSALRNKGLSKASLLLVILGYAAVQFVWFTYGNFSSYWKPYRFYVAETFL